MIALKVASVSCVTQYGDGCPEEVARSFDVLKTRPIIYLDATRSFEKIKSQYGQVQQIKVRKDFPDKVQVTVFFTKPAIALTILPGTVSHWYLVDLQGQLVGQSDNPINLPKLELTPDQWKFTDHKLSSEVTLKSIKLLFLLQKNFPQLQGKLSSSGDLTMQLDNITVIFSVLKDPANSVATLQLALRDPTIQKNPPKSIDLRFQNPVLSY